jgi:hypothetical protein
MRITLDFNLQKNTNFENDHAMIAQNYRYPISWEAFLDPSDSYFLFVEEQGYHR